MIKCQQQAPWYCPSPSGSDLSQSNSKSYLRERGDGKRSIAVSLNRRGLAGRARWHLPIANLPRRSTPPVFSVRTYCKLILPAASRAW